MKRAMPKKGIMPEKVTFSLGRRDQYIVDMSVTTKMINFTEDFYSPKKPEIIIPSIPEFQ